MGPKSIRPPHFLAVRTIIPDGQKYTIKIAFFGPRHFYFPDANVCFKMAAKAQITAYWTAPILFFRMPCFA